MATAKKAAGQTNLPFAYTQYSHEQLRDVLRKMYLIRRFEEGAEDSYMRGLIHGTMHLSIGQEASAVGICMPLNGSASTTQWSPQSAIPTASKRTQHICCSIGAGRRVNRTPSLLCFPRR